MATDLPQTLPKISDMSTIRTLSYTLDKDILQIRIVLFLDHEKSQKEGDNG